MKKQREKSRADEGLEVSEKSAVCLPQEKDPEQKCPSSLFQICTNTFSERKKKDGKG